jgi:para-aminobenzoate synthetase component 1
LVRNDLSKIATKNSVQVDELFGIYTFETVHQMISTISCQVDPPTSFTDILKATFPMGSMTGAPKISAMQLIERHEDFKRGLYSGSIGMIAPNGDFDFNVIIRSLIYNKRTQYLSCSVGGAITINSIPENEYEECNVKVARILNAMNA